MAGKSPRRRAVSRLPTAAPTVVPVAAAIQWAGLRWPWRRPRLVSSTLASGQGAPRRGQALGLGEQLHQPGRVLPAQAAGLEGAHRRPELLHHRLHLPEHMFAVYQDGVTVNRM
ncbi:MAG: hypothetical protein ABR540_14815 [Acidimicrobiales bacterium]